MTVEEADKLAKEEQELLARAAETSDPDRDAPKLGGAAPFNAPDQQRSEFGAGNVGGYNAFWIDRGSDAFTVDGKFRTSIIYEPKNGRQPAMTPKGMQRMMSGFASFVYENDGTASWLDKPGPGPFDGPESLALAERCILGFSAGPPMLPGPLQQLQADRADRHPRDDPDGDGARRARGSTELGAHPRRPAPVAGRLDRLVGRRHAGGRHHQLPRGDRPLRRRREPPPGREVHAAARRQPALRLHRHRPDRLDRAVERRVHLEGELRARLRVRLPRRQLRDGQHPSRREAAREGVQGQGRGQEPRAAGDEW